MARPATPILPVDKTLISEVLRRVSNAKTKDEKIQILIKYKSPALSKVLLCNFAKNVHFLFPEGKTPFTALDVPKGLNHQMLYREHRLLDKMIKKEIKGVVYYGCSGKTQPAIKQLKKEALWIQLLESLHADEAEVLDLIKDKKLTTKYKITKQNVIDAFPELNLENQ
jgi:hypothetical protein